ncbi:MAG: hypothetical protein ACT4PL_05445, partial [Phycisphaerales bacterium]
AEGDGASVLRDVTFRRCDCRDLYFCDAVFERCVFDTCKMRRMLFRACTFRDCQFVGPLDDMECYGHHEPTLSRQYDGLEGADFSRAVVRGVNFLWINFKSDQLFPRDGRHLAIYEYPETLRAGAAHLRERGTPQTNQLAGLLDLLLEHAGPHQTVGILHEEDLLGWADSPTKLGLLSFWGDRARFLK